MYNLKSKEQKEKRTSTYVIHKQTWTDPTRIHPAPV